MGVDYSAYVVYGYIIPDYLQEAANHLQEAAEEYCSDEGLAYGDEGHIYLESEEDAVCFLLQFLQEYQNPCFVERLKANETWEEEDYDNLFDFYRRTPDRDSIAGEITEFGAGSYGGDATYTFGRCLCYIDLDYISTTDVFKIPTRESDPELFETFDLLKTLFGFGEPELITGGRIS